MRYLDAVTHFFPKKMFDRLLASPGGIGDIGKTIAALASIALEPKVREHICHGNAERLFGIGGS